MGEKIGLTLKSSESEETTPSYVEENPQQTGNDDDANDNRVDIVAPTDKSSSVQQQLRPAQPAQPAQPASASSALIAAPDADLSSTCPNNLASKEESLLEQHASKSKKCPVTNGNADTVSTRKSRTGRADKNPRNRRPTAIAPARENGLSCILPGYTAPLALQSSSLDAYRPSGGLESIRQQALMNDHPVVYSTAKAAAAATITVDRVFPCARKLSINTTNKKKPVDLQPTAGSGWFQMRSTPLTESVKKDLQLIRNRNYLDPKRFYKSNDAMGKFIHVGTVLEGSSEYYSSRLTKRQRRTNLVDEVLADPDTATYAQNKFRSMQRESIAKGEKRRHRFTRKRGPQKRR